MKQYEPHNSSLGSVGANQVAMATYIIMAVFGGFWSILVAVAVLIAEKNSRLVKFSVVQSFLIMLVYNIASGAMGFIGGISGFSFFGFGWANTFAVWSTSILWGFANAALLLIYLAVFINGAVKAHRWQQLRLPLVSGLAERITDAFGTVAYNGDGPVPPQADPRTAGRPQGPYYPGGNAPQPPYQPPVNNQPQAGQPYQPPMASQPYQPPSQNRPAGSSYSSANDQLPPEMRDKK